MGPVKADVTTVNAGDAHQSPSCLCLDTEHISCKTQQPQDDVLQCTRLVTRLMPAASVHACPSPIQLAWLPLAKIPSGCNTWVLLVDMPAGQRLQQQLLLLVIANQLMAFLLERQM